MIDIDLRPKHQMAVPGLGVFIAPNAVARLFQLHEYRKCPKFLPARKPVQLSLFDAPPPPVTQAPVLYPILRPNVLYSPRYSHVSTRAKRTKERFRNEEPF